MDNNTIGMILTAIWGLLGLIAGGKALIKIRSFIKAMSESTDVPAALDNVMKTIQEAEQDGVWESGEVEKIKQATDYFKQQIQEAKDAWSNVQILLFKKLR